MPETTARRDHANPRHSINCGTKRSFQLELIVADKRGIALSVYEIAHESGLDFARCIARPYRAQAV